MIELNEQQLAQLSLEQLHVGTHLSNASGQHFLVFRDSFVALKVATRLGAKRSLARAVPVSDEQIFEPLAQFSNGDMLVAAG